MNRTSTVALVTGAGSGIGRATALALALDGVKIGALGRTGSEVETVAGEIAKAGGEAMALEADISDELQMRNAVNSLVGKFGHLDIVVANAGINGVWAPIDA